MKHKVIGGIIFLLLGWLGYDLYWPRKVNLREMEPLEIARLEAAMWRSYYEQRPILLCWQTAELMQTQLHAPFWRSFLMAYNAASAAFVFKEGKRRSHYQQALPYLQRYYAAIYHLSDTPFDVNKTAQEELEWWIIRRERDRHPPTEWATLQANIAAKLYQKPPSAFASYARLRTDAMLLRDQKGKNITEQDWQNVQTLLNRSWTALHKAVK
ncbi:MAG: hypothetical protein U0Y10_27520 [Spirosomataceae bacterium]